LFSEKANNYKFVFLTWVAILLNAIKPLRLINAFYSGKIPSARHGHAMLMHDKSIYIHGGMSGITFHKDLHQIKVTDYRLVHCRQWWRSLFQSGGTSTRQKFYENLC